MACAPLEAPARESGWEVYDVGEASGLAEAAWEELIINNEIVVPLLLEKGLRRERDNTLASHREVIRDGEAIRRKLRGRQPRTASGSCNCRSACS